MKEESELERLAAEEILLEAKRGLARANEFGASGWKPCPLPGTNKKFLHNTIRNVVSSNKLKEQKFERNLKKSKELLRQDYVSRSEKKRTDSKFSKADGSSKNIHRSRRDEDNQKNKRSPEQHHRSSHRK